MKKVLIINSFLVGDHTSMGVTLGNIFSFYDKDSILQLCLKPKSNDSVTSLKNTIYCEKDLSRLDFFSRNIFFPNRSMKKDGQVSLNQHIKQKGIKPALHDMIRGFLDMSHIHFSRQTIHSVVSFSPDCIYTNGTNLRTLKAALFFSRKLHIKIVLHLFDDWPQTSYTTSALSFFARLKLKQLLRKIHERSSVNLAISEALAEKYQLLYKKKYVPLMNPSLNIAQDPQLERESAKLTFSYFGSLGLYRWKSLLEVAQEIQRVCSQYHIEYEFLLFVPDSFRSAPIDRLFKEAGAELKNFVKPDLVPAILKKSDFLVIAESFDQNVCDFTKLSLSTKVPEYLSSGKPILAYIRPGQFSYEYLKKRDISFLAGNIEELNKEITALVLNDGKIRMKVFKGLSCAREEHSMLIVAEKIRYVVEQASTTKKKKIRKNNSNNI